MKGESKSLEEECRNLLLRMARLLEWGHVHTVTGITALELQTRCELLCMILMRQKVTLDTQLTTDGPILRMGDLVQQGTVFLYPNIENNDESVDGYVATMPYLFLLRLFRDGQVREAKMTNLKLMMSPTPKLSADENEKQDLGIICLRLYIASLTDETSLGNVLSVDTFNDISLNLTHCTRENMLIANFDKKGTSITNTNHDSLLRALDLNSGEQMIPKTILAQQGNSGPDSVICVWARCLKKSNDNGYPRFWCSGEPSVDEVPSAVWASLHKTTTQRDFFKICKSGKSYSGCFPPQNPVDTQNSSRKLSFGDASLTSAVCNEESRKCDLFASIDGWYPLVICVQNKLKTSSSNKLTTNHLWTEYLKCFFLHRVCRFLLFVISDGPTPTIPDELSGRVVVVSSEQFEFFFGPFVGKRRLYLRETD